uniref:Uncharacterized protein n=2 Tax=Acrobeloides nanus TaxID=290746 RepID=A0A914D6F5_9BILA
MKNYMKQRFQIKAKKFTQNVTKAQKSVKPKNDRVTRSMTKMKLSGQKKEQVGKPRLIIHRSGDKNEFKSVKHSVRKFENEVVTLGNLDRIEKELRNVLKKNIQVQKMINEKQFQAKSRPDHPKRNGSKIKENDRKRSRIVETNVEVSKPIPKPSEEELDEEERDINPAWHSDEFSGYHTLCDFYTFIQPYTKLIDAEFIKHWREQIVDKFNSENFQKLYSVSVSQTPAVQLPTPKIQNELHDDVSNQANSFLDENQQVLPDEMEENSMFAEWYNKLMDDFPITKEPTTSANPSLKANSLIGPTIFDDLGEELTKNLKLKGVLLDDNQIKLHTSEFITPQVEIKPNYPPFKELVEVENDVLAFLSMAKLRLASIEQHLLALIAMTYDRIKAEYVDNAIYRRLNAADAEVVNLVEEILTKNITFKTPALADDFRQKLELALEKRKIEVASIKHDIQPNDCLTHATPRTSKKVGRGNSLNWYLISNE